MTYQTNLSLMDYEQRGEDDNFSRYQFHIVENSGGGSCLFKALSQCRNGNESNHAIEREKVIEHAISEENWPIFKTYLVGQHVEEIDSFKNETAPDKVLQQEYSDYMSKQRSYGTMSELEIASKILPDMFSFSVLTHDNATWSVSVLNYTTPNAKDWYYFLFTGPRNSGHWERLDPIYFEREIYTEIPRGIFVEVGRENRHIYFSNQSSIKRVARCRRCSPLNKVKNFIKPAASFVKKCWSTKVLTSLAESEVEEEPELSIPSIPSVSAIEQEPESRKRHISRQVRFADLPVDIDSGHDCEPPAKSKRPCFPEVDPKIPDTKSGQRQVSESQPKSSPKCLNSPVSDIRTPSILRKGPSHALDYSFNGSRVLIFGGANGIGGELARILFTDNAEVLLVDTDKKRLRELRNANLGLMTLVSEFKDIDDIKDKLKSVDPFMHLIIVRKMPSGDVLELPPETRETLFNCVSTSVPIIKYFVEEMKIKGVPCNMERTVVNVFEDTVSDESESNSASEVCIKTMMAFTKSIAQDLYPKKVRVNSLHVVSTGLKHNSQCSGVNLQMSATNAALYLSSQMSELIFSETITVDSSIH